MNIELFHDMMEALYATLPKIDCQQKCGFRVCGPIQMTPLEYIRWSPGLPKTLTGMTCPMLKPDGLCGCYSVRPLICRLFGLSRELACPFGCEPEKWLTEEEVQDCLKCANKISDLAMAEHPELQPEDTRYADHAEAVLRMLAWRQK